MNCPACAHANRPGAKFCRECASPLPRACASCGAVLTPDSKFCDECGAAAGAVAAAKPSESSDARKVVTIVFADLVGSTALHERLDPESARRFMEGYYAAMRSAVESHGGTVTQFLGDGVKAVFGMPRVAEDDAIRAVRAAVAMQQAFRALAEPQREAVGKTGLRVAVNTGEVVANDATEIIGDPVNVAARLQEQGRDGDVVVGESTQSLVETLVTLELLGSFALKGRSEAVKAYRVISLERPVGVAASPFVGRDDELARISAVYETAVSKPATALAVLLGSPGLGKSRLIDELADRLGGDATVIRAHCDASGGASFAPLADALRALPGLDAALPGTDAERARILDGVRALLAGSPAAPEETFFVVRRLLAALAAAKPVVLVIDDLHWAEPLLLDLVEHLVQWGSGVPLLVLVGARPELRDMRSSLTIPGGLVSEVITLAGLDAGAAMRLAANVIGAADLPASVAAKVLATSEGNPLFVSELVRMLVHEGALKKEGERWTAGTALAALEMPPTIHALLAARIERLRPEERNVLERAAVIGRHFSRSAVADLLARDATDLDARLESLRRAELIERDSGWYFGEPGLRFHHVLIRDAAYRRILKGTRAELHARFADWTLARAGDSIEHDETIGWHLEQAHQFLRELGPIDARGRALGERAAQRLAAAGHRALARDDVSLAAGLLGRALDRLDPDDAARAELALDWCEALLAAGDVGPAAVALEELGRFAASDPRLRAWHTCFAGQLTSLTAPEGLNSAAEAVAMAADELAALGDVAGEAKAHFVQAQAFMRLGKVGACEAALDRALAAARRADDRRRANTVLAVAPLAALWGPSPVTRASGRCLDVVRVLRISQEAPAVEAVALSCQGVLEALRGRTDAARRMIASARKMVEELGITQRLLEADVFTARIDLLDGDAASAERGLRAAYEGMRELGLGIDAARAAALLARALLQLDRAEEAEAFTRESEQLAGDDLQAAIAWRGARAEALARRGETEEAVALASKAVEIAAATDALLDHADARLALAAALRAAGRTRDADTEERRATELWEAKGATLLAERARRESPRPFAAAPQPEAPAEAPRPARRRVRPIGLGANGAALEAAAAARDIAALERVFSDPCVVVHHPTGATYGRREQLSSWKSMFRAEHLTYRREVLATLGDSLELWRHWISVSGLGGQAYESFGLANFEEIVLCEDDGHGRYRSCEIFDSAKLGAAIARMYERHAELLLDDHARARAAGAARTARVMLGQPDLEATASVLAPDVEFSDLRTVGFGTLRGAESVLQTIAAMMDLSRDDSASIDDVLVLEPDALVVRWTNRGTHAESGGAFERNLCQLFAFDSAGRLSCWQQFEAEHDDAALARFDALVAGRAPQAPARRRVRPNSATASVVRFEAAIKARDLTTLQRMMAADFESIGHPTGTIAGQEAPLAIYGALLRGRDPELSHEALATLGDSLGLFKEKRSISALVEGESIDVGPALVEDLTLVEFDAGGLTQRVEIFATDHLGDAIARLYERYAELLSDGPERERAAATARTIAVLAETFELDRFAAALAPEVEVIDHRTVGFGSLHGAVALVGAVRAMIELSEGLDWCIDDVFALRADALLVRNTRSGAERVGGGAFEIALCELWFFGADGRITRFERFDVDRAEEALARFDELAGSGAAEEPEDPFENAASRTDCALMRCFNARDWEGVLARVAPRLVFDERRRLTRNVADREVWLEQFRFLFDVPESRFTIRLLATRGERLSLHRHEFDGVVAGGGGPLAMDPHLTLHEVDRDGRIVAIVLFDLEDQEAAYAELDARFVAGEGAAHPNALAAWLAARRALEARDWDAFSAVYAAAVVCRDHRLLGWGTLHGVASFVRTQQVLVELAPDSRWRGEHVATCERGHFQSSLLFGTRDGGSFELPFLRVSELDARGKVCRFDIYDVDQLEQARARFGELRAEGRRDPLAAFSKPNAASAAMERWLATFGTGFATGDWEPMRALCVPNLLFDDRRPLALLSGDRELMIASARERAAMGAQPEISLIGTAGERIALLRSLWSGGPQDGRFEIEYLSVVEVDAAGLIAAIILLDYDDPRAAQREAWARWTAIDPAAAAVATPIGKQVDAYNERDWLDYRATLADDVVVEDHRLAGMGRLVGADAYLASVIALWELSPVSRAEIGWFWPAFERHGAITVVRRTGTVPNGGGDFESENLYLYLVTRGRVTRVELFEIGALEAALARFEELRSDPLRVPPNAATRLSDQAALAIAAGDRASLRACASADFRFEDRGKRALVVGGVEVWLDSALFLGSEHRARLEQELLATFGDRIAVYRDAWSGSTEERSFELGGIRVFEVDDKGKLRALLLFDSDDRAAAFAEANARFASGEAASCVAVEGLAAFLRALNERDWDTLREIYTTDLVVMDHRPLGLGVLDLDTWIASLQATVELSVGLAFEVFRVLAWNDRGSVVTLRRHGSIPDGGGLFENFPIGIALYRGDRFARYELFEETDVVRALARFAELCASIET